MPLLVKVIGTVVLARLNAALRRLPECLQHLENLPIVAQSLSLTELLLCCQACIALCEASAACAGKSAD